MEMISKQEMKETILFLALALTVAISSSLNAQNTKNYKDTSTIEIIINIPIPAVNDTITTETDTHTTTKHLTCASYGRVIPWYYKYGFTNGMQVFLTCVIALLMILAFIIMIGQMALS